MSVIKVIEIMASSTKSWEDAAQNAIANATKKMHNIRSLYIKEFNTVVEGGKITEYRITGKMSVVWDDKEWGK